MTLHEQALEYVNTKNTLSWKYNLKKWFKSFKKFQNSALANVSIQIWTHDYFSYFSVQRGFDDKASENREKN